MPPIQKVASPSLKAYPLSEKNLWSFSVEELFSLLETTDKGLSQKEALCRLEHDGANELKPPCRSWVFDFLKRFQNPIILLLLGICIVAFFLGEIHDCLIITVMIVLSLFLDFFQEHSAHRAIQKLQDSVALKACVLRNQKFREIFARDIVAGDIVSLRTGDLVPADGRLIWDNHLYVNQDLLTGESFATEKNTHNLSLNNPPQEVQEMTNCLFMGTSVVSGEALMVVCQTGARTFLGSISKNLGKSSTPSPFESDMQKLGFFLMKMTACLVLFILLANVFLQRSWLEISMFSLALAVGMTPEFLPMVISVTLSRGVIKMARKDVIVKRPSTIHDLGRMDLLCTDKTGTLTQAKIQLAHVLDQAGKESEDVLKWAYLNSFFGTGLKSPLDKAILQKEGVCVEKWHKIDEVPFDFERRRLSVLLESKGERYLVVKGAPEDLLPLCTSRESPEGLKKMTPSQHTRLKQMYESYAQKGFRSLAIAWRHMDNGCAKSHLSDETNLIFSGFTFFFDPPKKEASETIHKLRAQNIEIYLLTGDHEEVTRYVCQHLGIPVKGLMTGAELETLDEKTLEEQIVHTNLYCRVNPLQKERLIRALKNKGHVVGFLGDGINDAPSLKTAHVGISVDTAADVAKEAADLILEKPNLKVIHEAVTEGRKMYSVMVKYVMMMMSANFGNMLSMAFASLFLPFLPMLPTQILLNNFLYNASQTAIPFDYVDKESMTLPQKWNLKFLLQFTLFMGPISSFFDFVTFFVMLQILKMSTALFQTGWFIESLVTQILIVLFIRTRLPFLQSKPHTFLLWLSLVLVAIGILIPYSPLGSLFEFAHLPLSSLWAVLSISFIYFFVVEKVKLWFYQHFA